MRARLGLVLGPLALLLALGLGVWLLSGLEGGVGSGSGSAVAEVPLPSVVVDAWVLGLRRRVAAFDFARAEEALERLGRRGVLSSSDRARLAAWRERLRRFDARLLAVGAAAEAGALKGVRLGLPGREGWWAIPTAADRHAVHVAYARDTRRRAPDAVPLASRTDVLPWRGLGASACWRLLSAGARHEGGAEGWLALAALFGDLGRPEEAERAIAQGWEREADRPALAAALAELRGDPAGTGYERLHGRLYNAGAIAAISEGKTRWGDRWVEPSARRELASGKVRRGERWVALTDAERRAAGWVRDAGAWLPPWEGRALRRKWATAWERQTLRVRVRTDVSAALMEALAEALDGRVSRVREVLGGAGSPGVAAIDDAFNARAHFGALGAAWWRGAAVAREAEEVGDLVLGRDAASLARALTGALGRLVLRDPPAWLDAGVGVFLSGGMEDGGVERAVLRWAAARGAAPPSLEDVLGGTASADLVEEARRVAYAGALVYCLADAHGGLLRALARGEAASDAVRAVESDWRAVVARLGRSEEEEARSARPPR